MKAWEKLVNKMGKKRAMTLLIVGLLLTMGGVSAAWVIMAQSSFTGYVTSTESSPLVFSTEFSDLNIDTTSNPVSVNTTGIITNDDGNMTLYAHIITTKNDIADNCTDYQDDCTVTYGFDGSPITDGELINITGGSYEVTALIDCVKLSCPQNITANVLFDENP